MGCGQSSPPGSGPEAGAKGAAAAPHAGDSSGDEHPSGHPSDNKTLIAIQEKQTILSLVETTGRKMSVGSVTEDVVNSFTEKAMDKSGDTAWTTELTRTGGLGFTCRKGLKPESPNQDSFSILKIENEVSVYGVYDGHGKKGHDSSEFVKHHLPQILCSDRRFKTDASACVGDSFLKTQGLVITADEMKHINAQLSGTTVSVVVHEHKK